MRYAVKVTGPTGFVCWLGTANKSGFRPLVPRDAADVFPTVQDAHEAIAILPRAFDGTGLIFSVEPAE
jgi:hypothetical protein